MGFLDLFSKKEEIRGTKVQVCGLSDRFDELTKNDARVYRRFYIDTTVTRAKAATDLDAVLAKTPDVLHLACDVTADGMLPLENGAALSGADLLSKCTAANVKLLWIASSNAADNYNKGFKPRGEKINLIMTLDRRGPGFTLFLDNLLTKVAAGESISVAWNELCPEGTKGVHPDAPDCIIFSGRSGVRLR